MDGVKVIGVEVDSDVVVGVSVVGSVISVTMLVDGTLGTVDHPGT